MSNLILIGLICAVITIVFTVWAAFSESQHGGQSMRDSITETWTNIAIGFGINYIANLLVLPLAGFHISAGGAFWIGVIFTAISVLRSFVIRRWFNIKMLIKSRSLTQGKA
jgi:hypothetical protein